MTIQRTPIIAGLAAGLASALWTLFEFIMGWHGPKADVGAMTGFVGILFPVLAITWALRRTKSALGGRITMKQSLTVGLSVAMILSSIGIVFYALYYTRINPGFLEQMQARGTPVTVASQLITVVSGSLVLSLLVAFVGGLMMRARAR
jgi:Protein of unknown function (DUF4199)